MDFISKTWAHIEGWQIWSSGAVVAIIGGAKTEIGVQLIDAFKKWLDRRKTKSRRRIDKLQIAQIKLQTLNERNMWKEIHRTNKKTDELSRTVLILEKSIIECRNEKTGLITDMLSLKKWKKRAEKIIDECHRRRKLA